MTGAAVPPAHPPPPTAGATLGVEEEFHLVDPITLALTPSATVVTAALAGEAGEHVHPEIVSTQLETSTGVCATLAGLAVQLTATRAEAAAAAARDGLALLAASTHPFGTWREKRLTAAPRYRAMVQRWGALADRQDICGCHVPNGWVDAARIATPADVAAAPASIRAAVISSRTSASVRQIPVAVSICVVVISAWMRTPNSRRMAASASAGLQASERVAGWSRWNSSSTPSVAPAGWGSGVTAGSPSTGPSGERATCPPLARRCTCAPPWPPADR